MSDLIKIRETLTTPPSLDGTPSDAFGSRGCTRFHVNADDWYHQRRRSSRPAPTAGREPHRHGRQTDVRDSEPTAPFQQWAAAVHGIEPHYTPEDVVHRHLVWTPGGPTVTTMLDWFHCCLTPEHADAAVAAERDSTGRSVVCHGAGWGSSEPVESDMGV